MKQVLYEAAAIWFWTAWPTAAGSALLTMAFRLPFAVIYLLAAMTVGPALAVLRGMRREQDRLSLTQRAMAETVALVGLLVLGGLLASWFK